ncbi:hypothetical protein NKH77_19220 [Streptomyces sp. M19]
MSRGVRDLGSTLYGPARERLRPVARTYGVGQFHEAEEALNAALRASPGIRPYGCATSTLNCWRTAPRWWRTAAGRPEGPRGGDHGGGDRGGARRSRVRGARRTDPRARRVHPARRTLRQRLTLRPRLMPRLLRTLRPRPLDRPRPTAPRCWSARSWRARTNRSRPARPWRPGGPYDASADQPGTRGRCHGRCPGTRKARRRWCGRPRWCRRWRRCRWWRRRRRGRGRP